MINNCRQNCGRMLMRIAICDDCLKDAVLLKRFLGGHEASVYLDAAGLLADMKDKNIRFDLYLLDIFMEQPTDGTAMDGNAMGGIELAKRLRKVQEDANICFVSTSDDFYREAYDLYAVQYLLKPVQESEVKKLLARVARSLAAGRQQKLSFQSRGRAESIPYSRIRYISSREHTISVCCTDGTVLECKGKLSELAAQVCGDTFLRCHQSFIVNMNYVDNLSGADLFVAGELIPVSRRYISEVKRRYQEILFEGVD